MGGIKGGRRDHMEKEWLVGREDSSSVGRRSAAGRCYDDMSGDVMLKQVRHASRWRSSCQAAEDSCGRLEETHSCQETVM